MSKAIHKKITESTAKMVKRAKDVAKRLEEVEERFDKEKVKRDAAKAAIDHRTNTDGFEDFEEGEAARNSYRDICVDMSRLEQSRGALETALNHYTEAIGFDVRNFTDEKQSKDDGESSGSPDRKTG